MTKDKKLSDNFWIKEFNYVDPHDDLLFLLQKAREELGQSITITKDGGSTRTFKEHFNIYYKRYADDFYKHIPWGSRHLPKYNTGLRAVDISSDGVTGKELSYLLKDIADMYNIHIGLGVGKNWVHIDVDRKCYATWSYNY